MPTFTDNAICIRLMDWSETSQIAVLLTREHGKISATAKGAKRTDPSSLARFSGGLELLTLGESVLIVKKTDQLATLTEWDLIDAHWHLRQHYTPFQAAMYAADLCHNLIQDHDPHAGVYDAMKDLLGSLNADHPEHAMLLFHWQLITELGYQPELHECVNTRERLDLQAKTYVFDPQQGGLTVDKGHDESWRVRQSTVEILRQAAGGMLTTATNEADIARANKLMCAWCREILQRHLNTMDMYLSRKGL